MKIETIQNELIDEFSMFYDWMERYEYMIELGKSLPLIDAKYKTDENIIKGCQSKVWLHSEFKNDKVKKNNFIEGDFEDIEDKDDRKL